MQDEEERMGTRATQQRGGGRDGHSAGMTGRQDGPLTESRSQLRGVRDAISSLLRPLARHSDDFRRPGTLRGGSRSRRVLAAAVAAISVIVGLLGAAGPAAADVLVSNLGQSTAALHDSTKLSVNDIAQRFTTGTASTGYCLESISIDFAVGASANDAVYVYLHRDNGAGQPDHPQGGQVTTLTKNGYNFEAPVAGVNKYSVRTAPRAENPWCTGRTSVQLAPNTHYWIYVWAGHTTTAQLARTNDGGETGKSGWTIRNGRLSKPEGSGYSNYSPVGSAMKMQVEGRIARGGRILIQARVTVTEGVDEAAEFEVRLDKAAANVVTVDYETENQTAFAGTDFEATSGTLTFQPGDTVKTVSVPIVDDGVVESDEVFNLRLSNPSGATISLATGVATIVDNPGVTASINDVTVTEGVDATADFVVSLNQAATSRITVQAVTNEDYDATEDTDYLFKSSTLTFNPGETEKVFSVTIIDDNVDDSGERFAVTIGLPTGDVVIADNRGICTILNHEDLTASFRNVPQDHDGSTAFTFDAEFNKNIAIGYADMRDHAFTVTKGEVTRARRNDGQSDSWEITVEPEGNDAVTVTLPGNRACATTGAICSKEDSPVQLSNSASATIAGPAEVVVTTPTITIAGGSGTEGDDDDIDFTVTLDEAATDTVTVDYATSDGTADAGDDYTAKSGTLTFSAGQTSKTISVSIDDDIENESDETFTVTLSNASGADLGTSTTTGTIRNRNVEPLTARFEGMPSEHDGSEFTFELHFSENPEAGYARLRDHAFTLSGNANVNQAQRKTQGSNQSWTIRVDPKGNEQVSITLPATTNCSTSGAICTGDGRKLSHSTSATIAGPPSISVADATVTEAAGAVLAFTVSLSRSSGNNVTVDYATSDGTATAGADYTATSGLLTIDAGSTSTTVDVTVLDDSHDDGGETLTLTLSNPSNGTLNDATATGTIENSDPLPKALVARFGRTAALHVVEQVEERVNAPRAPGFDGRVAGRQINRDMGRDFALDFLQQLGGGGYGYRQTQPGGRMTAAGTSGPQVGNSGRTSSLGPQNGLDHGDEPGRNARAAPWTGVRRGHWHGPRRRQAARRLELRAQPRDVERRDALLLEPQRAVPVLRPGRRPRTQRRRPDLDVRGRLRQGPDGHRRVPVPQPGARKVRRRRQRTGQLCGDRAVPLDRLQGQRAGHGVDRRRLRGRGADAQPGRWSTDRDGPVNGDGGRRRPRPDPRRRRRLRPRVQGGHAMGRNADEGRKRAERQPRLDQRRGQPAAHRARGLAEHDDRRPHGPDAERGNRNPSGRR